MPHAHVLCHITDALSLVAGSGVCANVCLCLLNHVVVSHEDYLMFFRCIVTTHTDFTPLCNPQFFGIMGNRQWVWMRPSGRDRGASCVGCSDRVCVIMLRCYFYPLSSCSSLSVARSSVLGWSSPETRVKRNAYVTASVDGGLI